MEKHTVAPENANLFKDWLANRGGVAVWRSINLSNPGKSWSTPALTLTGDPSSKPTWEAANEPERIITDIDEIVVTVPKEVKRFHVAIKVGGLLGMAYKLTDGATRRVHTAAEKANENLEKERKSTERLHEAWYEFDYSTQEAVIFVPDRTIPLTEWEVSNATID